MIQRPESIYQMFQLNAFLIMSRSSNYLTISGLAIGVIFGLSGSFVSGPNLQIVLYEISSLGFMVGTVLMTLKFFRQNEDLVAAGFLLLTIAEAVMSGGNALGQVGGQASFGAGMAMYVPSFLLICLPKVLPTWVRVTGIATTIPFAIAASIIFSGGQVLSTDALPGIGYGMLSLSFIGFIITLIKEHAAEGKEGQMREAVAA